MSWILDLPTVFDVGLFSVTEFGLMIALFNHFPVSNSCFLKMVWIELVAELLLKL